VGRAEYWRAGLSALVSCSTALALPPPVRLESVLFQPHPLERRNVAHGFPALLTCLFVHLLGFVPRGITDFTFTLALTAMRTLTVDEV
jgi:hypothetical protein